MVKVGATYQKKWFLSQAQRLCLSSKDNMSWLFSQSNPSLSSTVKVLLAVQSSFPHFHAHPLIESTQWKLYQSISYSKSLCLFKNRIKVTFTSWVTLLLLHIALLITSHVHSITRLLFLPQQQALTSVGSWFVVTHLVTWWQLGDNDLRTVCRICKEPLSVVSAHAHHFPLTTFHDNMRSIVCCFVYNKVTWWLSDLMTPMWWLCT